MQPPTKPLSQRIRTAGSITLLGFAFGQALRLLSNIIMARLLFPEAFGTMAILQTILVGATMLTDVGLSTSLVRSRNGDDPVFLNAIWTLQIIKGAVVAALLVAISIPVAHFYRNDELTPMLATIGLVALIGALKSTKMDTATRNMQAKRTTAIEFVSQALTLVVTALLAWQLKSPWALLLGNITYASIRTILSHTSLPGVTNRLAWSKATVDEIIGFSSWILLGSTVTYFAGEGLSLVRAKLVTMQFMGQWSIAASLAAIPGIVSQRLSGQVLFPAYAETIRLHPEKLGERVKKARRVILLFNALIYILMILLAPFFIKLIYDNRYSQVAFLVQVTALGAIMSTLYTAYSGVLDAIGKPQYSIILVAAEGLLRIIGIIAGAHYYGEVGMVVGSIVVMPIINLVCYAIFYKFKLNDSLLDSSILILVSILAIWVAIYR